MTRFSQNCASEVANICQASSYCRVVTKNIPVTGTRHFNLKSLNCSKCSVETALKRILTKKLGSYYHHFCIEQLSINGQ